MNGSGRVTPSTCRQHPAPPEIRGKAFGISEAIGKTAQERARPALEAREAEYGWMRQTAAESH